EATRIPLAGGTSKSHAAGKRDRPASAKRTCGGRSVRRTETAATKKWNVRSNPWAGRLMEIPRFDGHVLHGRGTGGEGAHGEAVPGLEDPVDLQDGRAHEHGVVALEHVRPHGHVHEA